MVHSEKAQHAMTAGGRGGHVNPAVGGGGGGGGGGGRGGRHQHHPGRPKNVKEGDDDSDEDEDDDANEHVPSDEEGGGGGGDDLQAQVNAKRAEARRRAYEEALAAAKITPKTSDGGVVMFDQQGSGVNKVREEFAKHAVEFGLNW